MFDKKIETNDDTQTIKLIGDLDVYSEDDFRSFIDEEIDTNKDLIIDLEELEYLDSTGLGSFISLLKLTRDEEKEITVKNLKKNIKKVFKITDLDKLFNLGDDE